MLAKTGGWKLRLSGVRSSCTAIPAKTEGTVQFLMTLNGQAVRFTSHQDEAML